MKFAYMLVIVFIKLGYTLIDSSILLHIFTQWQTLHYDWQHLKSYKH